MTLTRAPPPKARAAHAGPRRPGRQIKSACIAVRPCTVVVFSLPGSAAVTRGHWMPSGQGEDRFRWRRLDPYPPSPIAGHWERVADACPPVLSPAARARETTSCGQSTMFWSWVPVWQG